MSKQVKNIIMFLVIAITTGSIYFTMSYAKSHTQNITNNPMQTEGKSTPPDIPSEENTQKEAPPAKPNEDSQNNNQTPRRKNLAKINQMLTTYRTNPLLTLNSH